MLDEFLQINVYAFFMIFCRVGAAFMVLPGFSAAYVQVRARAIVALAVSLIILPLVQPLLPPLPTSIGVLTLSIMREITVGLFLGVLGRLALAMLQVAGTVISMMAGIANAMVQDAISEQQGSIITSFLLNGGLLLIFVTDLHHLMIGALVDSYVIFDPVVPLIVGDMLNVVARHLGDSFNLGLRLASPIVIVGLCYYVVLGVLGRLMPALPVFFFALPIQISLQFFILMAAVASMFLAFLTHFQQVFQTLDGNGSIL